MSGKINLMSYPAASLLSVVLIALLSSGCEDIFPTGKPKTQPADQQYNDAYTSALSVADRFCHAWLTGDKTSGKAMLSLSAPMRYPAQQIDDAFIAEGNPRHAAYQILEGKRLDDGRYSFDIRLFYRYTGGHSDRLEAPLERIVVGCDATERWAVDEFPFPRHVPANIRVAPAAPK